MLLARRHGSPRAERLLVQTCGRAGGLRVLLRVPGWGLSPPLLTGEKTNLCWGQGQALPWCWVQA